MRYSIPCQIDVFKILNNTLPELKINSEEFNFDSIINSPICNNNIPIGIIMDDNDNACLWLDIEPEFIKINDKWHLSVLNVNMPNQIKR